MFGSLRHMLGFGTDPQNDPSTEEDFVMLTSTVPTPSQSDEEIANFEKAMFRDI